MPPDLRERRGGPLVVLLLVRGQLLPAHRLGILRGALVLLVLGAAAETVGVRIGHCDGLPQVPRVERLHLLRPPQHVRREARRPAPGGQQPLQRRDLRLQLLGAPPGLGLPRLAVRLPLLAVLPGDLALVRPLLPFLFALLLHRRPVPGLLLALLLALRLGPHAYQSIGAAAHTVHALPRDTPRVPEPRTYWLHDQR
ncbi:hypothetical protein GCM10020000_46900 [Streptomyces olivoverticillatus]